MELDIETRSIYENHDLLRNLRNDFADIIKEVDLLLIYKSHKYNYLPGGLLEKE